MGSLRSARGPLAIGEDTDPPEAGDYSPNAHSTTALISETTTKAIPHPITIHCTTLDGGHFDGRFGDCGGL